ncbi:serine/threonine-protein kinase [Streptomyces sp. NBC_00247]|uniref:protein kinase domain-containing protein n=1 Tax=Streptomyces sp. NBC_00247 TaxID=2975689 RepID=UPI002E2A6A5A|nr:PQQ-binding-like beta-propeller repeat protein [Streptomyces sp. NBC_00247]
MALLQGDPPSIGGYRLLDRLGSGGMGTVYLAQGGESGRMVAVKVVHQQLADDMEFRIRFRQEVAAARRVSGAFTTPVVDADPEAERPWMATLYTPGRSLRAVVRDEGPLTDTGLRQLAVGLVEALRDIHRVGVIHRDLKPDNVLLTGDGPRVIDFGISRAPDHQTLTVTGRILGTPPYMSPEQLSAPHGVKQASDVFSLGSVLVFATTGHGPFDAGSPFLTYNVVHEPAAVAELSGTVREVVQWCLAKDPADRPTPDELLVAFRSAPEDDWGRRAALPPARAEADAAPVPARKPLSRRGALIAGAGALAAAGGLGSWAARVWDGADRPGTTGSGKPVRPLTGSSAAGAVPALEKANALQPAGWARWQQKATARDGDENISSCHASATVLVCASSPSTGQIAAFATGTGTRLWSRDSPLQTELLGLSHDGRLAYTLEESDARDGEGRVVAVDAATGKPVWSTPPGSANPYATCVRTSDLIIVFDVPNGLVAWHAQTGDRVWQAEDRGSNTQLYTAHDRVYRLTDDETLNGRRLQELSTEDGKILSAQSPGSMVPVAFAAETVLLRRPDGALVISDWQTQPTSTTLPSSMEFVEEDGTFYGVDPDGTVVAADARTGKRRWTTKTLPTTVQWPWSDRHFLHVSGKRVHVSNADGSVHCFASASGAPLWQTAPREDHPMSATGGRPAIAVYGDTVYLLTEGTVTALRPPQSDES